jgi:predicted small metal-binding protein
MNCTVCGNPLLFDRVVFHCSCGAFVHAYCWDKHVLQAHKPSFELGTIDPNGEFRPRANEIKEIEEKDLVEHTTE